MFRGGSPRTTGGTESSVCRPDAEGRKVHLRREAAMHNALRLHQPLQTSNASKHHSVHSQHRALVDDWCTDTMSRLAPPPSGSLLRRDVCEPSAQGFSESQTRVARRPGNRRTQAFSSITGQLQDGQRRKQKKIKIWQEIDERNPGSLSQAVEKSRRSLAAAGAPDDENEPRVRFRDVIHVNNGTATSREGRIRRALLSESLRRRQEHGFDFQSLRGIWWWFALRFRNEPRRRQSLCDR